jgi:hypothetical protein
MATISFSPRPSSAENTISRRAQCPLVLRGQRVILDTDVAASYGVQTQALNQAIERNSEGFLVGDN